MKLAIKLKKYFRSLLRPREKDAFVLSLPIGARLIDVGCGNNSLFRIKDLRPDLYYVGLDIQDYIQSDSSKSVADEYVLVEPDFFLDAIESQAVSADAILSAHNLEHCEHRFSVLKAMCDALKPGGILYLSFPSEASAHLPSRYGTLAYHDDPTHVGMPPSWAEVIEVLRLNGLNIEFACARYRPFIPFLIGAVLEPWSKLSKRLAPIGSTWALYGFETVIWARKS